MLKIVPMANVKAKPLINEVVKIYKITAAIKVVTCESRIEDQARSKPILIAEARLLPSFTSSLILEKIKIFPSTAMPSDKIKPAIPAKVRVTGSILKIVKTETV